MRVRAPASSSAAFGSVNSTCSKPSATKIATVLPRNCSFMMIPPVDDGWILAREFGGLRTPESRKSQYHPREWMEQGALATHPLTRAVLTPSLSYARGWSHQRTRRIIPPLYPPAYSETTYAESPRARPRLNRNSVLPAAAGPKRQRQGSA